MRKFTFAKWLTTKETFNSFAHYKKWLSLLPKEEALTTDLYYHEKFKYFLTIQTEWD